MTKLPSILLLNFEQQNIYIHCNKHEEKRCYSLCCIDLSWKQIYRKVSSDIRTVMWFLSEVLTCFHLRSTINFAMILFPCLMFSVESLPNLWSNISKCTYVHYPFNFVFPDIILLRFSFFPLLSIYVSFYCTLNHILRMSVAK